MKANSFDVATSIADSITNVAAQIRHDGSRRVFTSAQVADILTEFAAITLLRAECLRPTSDTGET